MVYTACFMLLLVSISSVIGAPYVDYRGQHYGQAVAQNQLAAQRQQYPRYRTYTSYTDTSHRAPRRDLLKIREDVIKAWRRSFDSLAKLRLKKLRRNMRALRKYLKEYTRVARKPMQELFEKTFTDKMMIYSRRLFKASLDHLNRKQRLEVARWLLNTIDYSRDGKIDVYELEHSLDRRRPNRIPGRPVSPGGGRVVWGSSRRNNRQRRVHRRRQSNYS